MSLSESLQALLAGVVGGAGWVRFHRHPDLVPREELQPQLDLILSELRYLRERLDKLSEGR